jgi:arsenate reductase (glutaredoxin)
MGVQIYHNPKCSKSRATLALLEEHGVDPEVILYLENPPTAGELDAVLTKLGREPRALMRKGEAPFKDKGLENAAMSRDALIEAMVGDPILIERPIVVNGSKAAVGRPPEAVLEIL